MNTSVFQMYCKATPRIAEAIKETHELHNFVCAYFTKYPDKDLHSEVEA